MKPSEHLDILEREAAAFVDALRVGHADADVAGCPGWTLADLGRHLGRVHRWARVAVGTGPDEAAPRETSGSVDDADIHAWFVEGAAELVATLRAVDPEQPCWSMAPPSTARYWMRRQAHETTLHGWDAATCVGADMTIAADVALDGLDEAVGMFLPRQVRLGRLVPAPEVVHLVAGDTRFVVTIDAAHRDDAPVGVVTGTPDALLLLLWGRLGLDDVRVRVDGDVETTRAVLARPLTP